MDYIFGKGSIIFILSSSQDAIQYDSINEKKIKHFLFDSVWIYCLTSLYLSVLPFFSTMTVCSFASLAAKIAAQKIPKTIRAFLAMEAPLQRLAIIAKTIFDIE